MSRTVGIIRLDDKLAVTPRDSSSSSDTDEPSETTNSVRNSNDDDSHNRGVSSPVRWFSNGDDSSFTTSPRVSPSEPESSDFYDDTLASADTQMTKRSTVMISSISKSMNFLLQQEAIEMDIPKSPTVSIVLSDSEFSEFAVSADESKIELRDAVNNIVQTLDVTGATGVDSLANSESGVGESVISSKFCIKEEKHVDLLADARGNTSGHQTTSVGVVKQERDDSVPIQNRTEQSDDERQRNDDLLECTSAAYGRSGTTLGEAVTGIHVECDSALSEQSQLQSDDNQDQSHEASVTIIIGPTVSEKEEHVQAQDRIIDPSQTTVGVTQTQAEEGEDQQRNESLDRTIVPNDDQNPVEPVNQEQTTDCPPISPSDSLGNDHLQWNESSTPDSIRTPIETTVTAAKKSKAAAVADAAAAPIKLDPITKDMRYTRGSARKSTQSVRQKKVHFKEATPPRKEAQPYYSSVVYRTKWDTQKKDPYDLVHIDDDDDSGDQLFSNKQSCKTQNAASSEEDDDKDALIKSYILECSKDFEQSSVSLEKKVNKNKNKKRNKKRMHQPFMLVDKDMLQDAVEQAVARALKKQESVRVESKNRSSRTESKKTQTSLCIETNDVAVQTPKKIPCNRTRKTSKTKAKPPPIEDPKQTSLTRFMSRGSPEREPPANVMTKGSFRKPPPSFTTTPSVELSPVSVSPTLDCGNEDASLWSINVAEHPSFFRLLDDLRLSPVDSNNPDVVDDVGPSQHPDDPISIIRSGEYVCTIRNLHSENALRKTFTIAFNDNSDILPEEKSLSYIAESLAEKIKSNTLKPLEELYDAPQSVNTSFIQRLLTQGPDYNLNTPGDDYDSEDDDEEIDSGMDETIKPAASYTTIRYRHCSSAKGSQEPVRYSPGYSPIRFSGTPIARNTDQMTSRTPIDSPDRTKVVSERRALYFRHEM
ncbi:hypothetical protein RP20_CCG025144 [Aedes albopictus]|nr:hypothetical protein RP20_CCG025144 [Aedes albopictus]